MKDKRILIIGSQHGDEYSGERLYLHIKRVHPSLLDRVTFVIGNPKARKEKRRFIESDMNRSYTGRKDTYEQRRAIKILNIIDNEGYDLVLDLHTTTVNQPPCLILAEINERNEPFLHASSFEHIVVMGTSIANTSLNGARTHTVSIEVHKEIGPDLLESICWDIERYINDENSDHPKNVYRETQPLHKSEVSEEDMIKLQNFKLCEFGYYPIMIGEQSYKNHTDYVGFKAYKRNKFKV
jgi:hypothetical protein